MFTFVCEKEGGREGEGEEQWRKWHARPHRRTDGPAGNCIARIGRELCLCLSLSFRRPPSLSARLSFPGRVSGPRCPPSCPLTIVNRPPVPAYPAHPSSVRSSSIRSPSTRRFTLPREAEWQRLFPENGSQIDGRMEFPGNEWGPYDSGLTEWLCSV